MYERVTTVQLQRGVADDVTQYIRDSVLPAAKQAKGFGGIQILINPVTNMGIAITFWDSEADMAAGEASGGYYAEALAGGAQFFATQPVREAFEVRIKE
jgi:heme-degrading monooxygenase HmoA